MSKTISDIASVIDCLHATPEYSSSGYPMVRVENVKNDFLNLSECYLVDEATCDYHNKNYTPKRDDIIITRVGSFGLIALVDTDDKFCLGQNIAIISPYQNGKFLYYYLQSPYIQKFIHGNSGGSSYKSLSLEHIKRLPLVIDGLKISKIESILYNIDTKIHNNNAICADLEGMAKLLYDYWFVQFDFPDENGKPYKSSGGKMVWNEELKREIPDGWKVKELDDYIRIIRGISYTPEDEFQRETEGSIRLLKSNNIQNGALNFEQPIILPADIANEDQWLTEGSVFITMSSGSKKHMGKTAIVFKSLPYVFGAFCAKIAIKPEYRCILSTYFRSDWFRVYIENVTAGTSINNIGQEHLTKIKLPFPSVSILSQYESIVSSLFIKQGEIIEENKQLASLRDFLLPMLMNGQVKVKKEDDNE